MSWIIFTLVITILILAFVAWCQRDRIRYLEDKQKLEEATGVLFSDEQISAGFILSDHPEYWLGAIASITEMAAPEPTTAEEVGLDCEEDMLKRKAKKVELFDKIKFAIKRMNSCCMRNSEARRRNLTK